MKLYKMCWIYLGPKDFRVLEGLLLRQMPLLPNMALNKRRTNTTKSSNSMARCPRTRWLKPSAFKIALDNVAVALNRLKMNLGTLALPAVESFAKNLEHFSSWFEKWESKADCLFGAIGKLFGGNVKAAMNIKARTHTTRHPINRSNIRV